MDITDYDGTTVSATVGGITVYNTETSPRNTSSLCNDGTKAEPSGSVTNPAWTVVIG